MSITKAEKQKYFMVLATLQVIFACIILINELMAVSRQFPMTNFPIEHKYSWEKVWLYCGGANISILVAWFFTAKKHLAIFLPSLKFVLLLAAIPTLSGIVLSHYLSVIGWCC